MSVVFSCERRGLFAQKRLAHANVLRAEEAQGVSSNNEESAGAMRGIHHAQGQQPGVPADRDDPSGGLCMQARNMLFICY